MIKYLLCCACMSSLCFAGNLTKISPVIINADMTIENPGKNSPEQLMSQYFNQVENYLAPRLKNKSYDLESIKKQKRDFKKDNNLYQENADKLKITSYMRDRLGEFSFRLECATGDAYHEAMKTILKQYLQDYVTQDTDPKNVLRSGFKNFDKNRDFLYQYLSLNFPGKKTVAKIRAMSYRDILKELEGLLKNASKKGVSSDNAYIKLLESIKIFFNNELAKQEYDAYIDGKKSLDALLVTSGRAREALKYSVQRINDNLLNPVREKLNQIQKFLQPLVNKKLIS